MNYKRGTSFDYTGVVKDDVTGHVQDITDWTAEAKIRTEVGGRADALIASLVGSVVDGPTGVYRVSAETVEETKAWPLGPAVFDIIFGLPGGARVPIEDFIKVKVIDPATRDD